MPNVIDYLETYHASFEESPFNPVDSIALSAFCMIELDDILADIPRATVEASPDKRYFMPWKKREGAGLRFTDILKAEHFDTMFRGFTTYSTKQCMFRLAASPRFRDMTIHSYRSVFDHDSHLQFAATAFVYKEEFAYIGFRGTDTSLTGWREDFDMAGNFPVPAQEEALLFLTQTIQRLPKKLKHIYVGGHSKGANLAVYASLCAPEEIQCRITRVFDHDGPGFRPHTVPTNASIITRIHKTIPRESIVGVIMSSVSPYHAIESTEHGMMQHDLFSWVINGNDLTYVDDISESGLVLGRVTQKMVEECTIDEIRAFVALLFSVLESAGAEQVPELTSDWKKTAPLLVQKAMTADKQDREVALKVAKTFSSAFIQQIKLKLAD